MTTTPAVSVIIPMFNAAKYVGQCLESILAQTFTDFEVIIVDDCSTDSSCAIVESYASKFGGRLALLQLDRNTGSGAVPRNTGLKFARGEYIFFADADDLLTLTALEELHTLAKNFDAEVVYCERHYKATPDLSEIVIEGEQSDNVTRPTFESEDLTVRVDKYLHRDFFGTPWSKFVRRDFIVDNEIFFPPCKIAEDDIWTSELVLSAKKFLRVPNIVYVFRKSTDSVSRTEKTPLQTVIFWTDPIAHGVKVLNEFMKCREFFRENPDQRYNILEAFIRPHIKLAFYDADNLSPEIAVDTLENVFKPEFGAQSILFAHLCSMVNDYQKLVKQQNRRIDELERKLEEKLL